MAWEEGFEGCDDPFDLGWKHGTEDIGGGFKYRPGINLSSDEFDDYKSGYQEAREGWD